MSDDVTIGVTIDCKDAAALSEFWREVLRYDVAPLRAGADWRTLRRSESASGLNHLHFQPVAEGRAVKNRVHLDLFVDELDVEPEAPGSCTPKPAYQFCDVYVTY